MVYLSRVQRLFECDPCLTARALVQGSSQEDKLYVQSLEKRVVDLQKVRPVPRLILGPDLYRINSQRIGDYSSPPVSYVLA